MGFSNFENLKLRNAIASVGRDSSVDVTTRYGFERSRDRIAVRGEIFRTQRLWGPPSSRRMGTGLFPGLKRPGPGDIHSPSSGIEVKERVEPYLYSPVVQSLLVLN